MYKRQEYGFSKEFTVNVVKPGKSGAEEIKAMMENFRANPPKEDVYKRQHLI